MKTFRPVDFLFSLVRQSPTAPSLAANLFSRQRLGVCTGIFLAALAFGSTAQAQLATTIYWDINGATSGASGASTASGTWDQSATANWSADSGGAAATATWATASAGVGIATFSAGTNATGTSNIAVGTITGLAGMTFEEGTVNLTGGTLTLGTIATVNTGANNVAIGSTLAGGFGITKIGTGTLTLSGANTYSGATNVNLGTLRVNGTIAAGAVTVNGGATLAGGGTIGGAVTTAAGSGGRIDPGDISQIGNLNVSGNFIWGGSTDGSATMLFQLDSGGVSDKLVVTGSFQKGPGTSFIFNFGGGGTNGIYTLVQATGTQNFVATDLGYTNLAPGFSGSFNTSDPQKIRFIVGSDVAPTISISAPSVTSTNIGPVTYTVTYVDDNFSTSTLSSADITLNVTGTATGTVDVSGSGASYTVTISSISGDGSLGISIAAGTGTDLNGHTAAAGGPSTTFGVGNTIPVITSVGTASSVYGSSFSYTLTSNITATLAVTGLPTGLTFDPSTGIISGTAAAVGVTNATLSASDAFGNTVTKTLAITITPKTVTVSGLTVVPRAPNGTTVATLNTSNVVLAGLIGTDFSTVTLNISGAVATFLDGNPGQAKPVNVTGLTLVGSAAANYVLTNPTITGTIIGQSATVTLSNLNQVFDASPKPVTVATVPAGLTVVVTYNGLDRVPTSVGTYAVLAVVSDTTYGGSAAGNLVIAALGQSITFAALPDRSTSDEPFTISASATSALPVTFSISGPATLNGNTVTLTGGTGTVTITASQPGNGNYGTATSVVRTFTVSDRPVPGVYIGSFSGDRADAAFGLVMRSDNTAVFAGFLPTLGIGLFSKAITVDQTGSFSTTFAPFGNTIIVTVRGRIAGTSISGNVAPFAVTFAGTSSGSGGLFSDTGSFINAAPTVPQVAAQLQDFTPTVPSVQAAAGVGGLYELLVTGSTGTTKVTVFAGSDGRAYIFSTDGVRAAGGSATISNGGTLSATLSDQSQLSIAFSSGAAAGTFTPAGGAAVRVFGGDDTLNSTQRIINLSVLGRTRAGDETLVTGFSLRGSAPKRVLIRVAGPALTKFPAVSSPLANPSLQLYAGSTPFGSNDDWGNTSTSGLATLMASVGAFPFDVNSRDAAMVVTLAPGSYSVHALGGDGMVLTEIYELLETGETPGARQLSNISTRGLVGVGGEPLTAGFYIVGPLPKKVLVRGVGPTLTTYGVTSPVIANPRMKLYRDQTLIKENDDWFRDPDATLISAAAVAAGAFPLGAQSPEAAILIVLEPGAYSAKVENVNGTTAIGLVEVYEVP